MTKPEMQNDLFNQIDSLEKEIEAFRSDTGSNDKLVSETLAYMKAEINIAKNRLAEIPQKSWVKKTRRGVSFIPLLLQTHKMIHDSINILRRPRPVFKKEPHLNNALRDEGLQELITRLKENNY